MIEIGDNCLLEFYLSNDAAAERIPALDPALLFFSEWVSPVSTNGDLSDTRPKVNCPLSSFGVMKIASVLHTQSPSLEYHEGCY